MKLSIVVPVYNEKGTICEILQRIEKTPFSKEIIVIDDSSTDGTREILQELDQAHKVPSVRVLFHAVNQGKGAALRTGISSRI
jgi:glycosyltransferase involved in cell wall biosynthesis